MLDAQIARLNQSLRSHAGGSLNEIDSAQTAWQLYADRACDVSGLVDEGGSQQRVDVAACHVNLAEDRIRELQADLRQYGP